MISSKNFIAIPPGETIREQLDIKQMSQKEFSCRMGITEKHISRLINGKVELTSEMALRLESVLGMSASFWLKLEKLFREDLARVEQEKALEVDAEMARKFPYAKMAGFSWVKPTKNINEKIVELRAFFEVAELKLLEQKSLIPGIAYRVNGESENVRFSLIAWAQKAKMEARDIETAPINIEKLNKNLNKIRKMTIENPSCFSDELRNLLAACGIAIVFLPHIEGSGLHGATFVDNKRIVLGLTVRGKDADKFWFSLFHELYHIIEGHIDTFGKTTSQQESDADQFAKEILIPKKAFDKFIAEGNFSRANILSFANKLEIAPGIVVGRLQKEKYIEYSYHNALKTKYIIK